MIADHTEEIEYLRTKVVGLLSEKPPRRLRASKVCARLNRLIQLQLKREMILSHQASRCRPNPILGAPPGEGGGGSPDARGA